MGVDIRFPIGLMFAILGALLAVYGALTGSSDMYARHSLGINVNLWWGLPILIFGLVMLRFGLRGMARGEAGRPPPAAAGEGPPKGGPGGGH